MSTIGVSTGADEGQKTFLEIVQQLVRECRLSHQSTSLPTTVLNQTGILLRMVELAAEAWHEIQCLHEDWKFMRRTVDHALVEGQFSYRPDELGVDAGTFGRWYLDTFRSYITSVGKSSEMIIDDIPYDVWRNSYQFGTLRTVKNRPMAITMMPDRSLAFGPTPQADISVVGDYHLAPEMLEVDEDIPNLPIHHSTRIIVYKAMIEYGLSTPAPEVMARGQSGYNRLLNRLQKDQLPVIPFAGAIA